MTDYIERDAAIEAASRAFDDWYVFYVDPERDKDKIIAKHINALPAADVQPVVRSEWLDTGSGQECSACGEFQPGYDSYRNFCPYCGADMRGEDE